MCAEFKLFIYYYALKQALRCRHFFNAHSEQARWWLPFNLSACWVFATSQCLTKRGIFQKTIRSQKQAVGHSTYHSCGGLEGSWKLQVFNNFKLRWLQFVVPYSLIRNWNRYLMKTPAGRNCAQYLNCISIKKSWCYEQLYRGCVRGISWKDQIPAHLYVADKKEQKESTI